MGGITAKMNELLTVAGSRFNTRQRLNLKLDTYHMPQYVTYGLEIVKSIFIFNYYMSLLAVNIIL